MATSETEDYISHNDNRASILYAYADVHSCFYVRLNHLYLLRSNVFEENTRFKRADRFYKRSPRLKLFNVYLFISAKNVF